MIREKIEDRISLVPITKAHTEFIVKWRNNKRVYDSFIFSEKFTTEMHNDWLDKRVSTGEVVQFIIYVKAKEKPIGSVYFRDIDYEKKVAEYGIFIGEDEYVGKGYGTETTKIALEYAFNELKLQKIFLRVFADNKGAIKTYRNVGFEKTEYLSKEINKNGKMHDLIFMECKNPYN